MMQTMPDFLNGFLVGRRWISHVGRPSVLRKLKGEPIHPFVAMGLGQNARRRNRQKATIPFDFAGVRY